VKFAGPDRFSARPAIASSASVSCSANSLFDPSKPVQILFGGKLVEKKVVPDAKVLLGDFVERFDASFLPIAAVDVPEPRVC
jgi:hypothetical protein